MIGDRELFFVGVPVVLVAIWFVWVARRKRMSGGEIALGLAMLAAGAVGALGVALGVIFLPMFLTLTMGDLGWGWVLLLGAIAAWPLLLTNRWARKPKKNPFEGAGRLVVPWVVATVVGGTGFLILVSLSYGPGHFDRAQMEAIVNRVRQKDLQPGTQQFFKDTGHRVWAECTEAGKLSVVIETVDGGKSVHFGFAYCEGAATPDQVRCLEVPGPFCLVTTDGPIDDHWWPVESWE